jgi:hypothetical protein
MMIRRITGQDHRAALPISVGHYLKPSWQRLLDCSIFAMPDCFAVPGTYNEYPSFEAMRSSVAAFDRGYVELRNRVLTASMEQRLAHVIRGVESSETVPTTAALSCPLPETGRRINKGSADLNVDAAYDLSLRATATAARALGVRAAFTMADRNYASHIAEVVAMSTR